MNNATQIKPLILYTKDGKPAIYIRGHVGRKEVCGSLHMNHTPPGWGMSDYIFDQLKRYGVDTIQVYDKETKKLYVASRVTFEENFVPIDHKAGPQRVLAIDYWKVFDN